MYCIEFLYLISDIILMYSNSIIYNYFKKLIINIMINRNSDMPLYLCNYIVDFLDFKNFLNTRTLNKVPESEKITLNYIMYYYKLILKYINRCENYLNYLNTVNNLNILQPPSLPHKYVYIFKYGDL